MSIKQALRALVFIIIALFIGVSLSYILRSNGDVKNRFTGFYAEDRDTIDVMIYGASPANATFVPGVLWHEKGITSYSLSSNSQSAMAIRYLIDETHKYQHPQLIIVEPRMFASDIEANLQDKAHIREVTDNLRYSPLRIKLINALLDDEDNKLEYYADIIKYHSNIGMLFDPTELKHFDYSAPSSSKGYAYEERVGYYKRDDSVDMDKVVPISEEGEEVLRDFLDYAKNENLNVLFVSTPRVFEQEYEGNMNYIESVVREYGYDFLNLNHHLEDMDFWYGWYFYDGVHVNILGAYNCTKYLGDYIEQHYDIDTAHDGLDRASWDGAYNEFMEKYEPLYAHVDWKKNYSGITEEELMEGQ